MRISDWSADVCSSDLTGLDIEKIGDEAAVKGLDFSLFNLSVNDPFAFGFQPELVVILADPAFGIPVIGVLPVAGPIFKLFRLEHREELVVLRCPHFRSV